MRETELAQLDIANYVPAKYCFVWHQSFIFKSCRQTSRKTHKQTNTQGENIITFAIEGDKPVSDN